MPDRFYNQQRASSYGRGYSGRSNYYQGFRPQGIISMFDPGSMDMIAQAASSRQQRFDAGATAVAQERARIAGMETADPAEAAKQLKAFEEKINTKVQDTYGGDYGAAVNAITNLIGAERANPFYKFNAAKIKALDLENRAIMSMGADYMAAKSPMDISFEDYQKGQTDFSFTPINRQTIVKRSADVFGQYAKQIMDAAPAEFKTSRDGKFLERTVQYGFSDKEGMMDFIENNPEIIKTLMDTPGFEGLDEQDVRGAILEGAHAGIGHTQVDTRANPDYINAYQQSTLDAKTLKAQQEAMQGSGVFLSPKEVSKVPLTKGETLKKLDNDPDALKKLKEISEKYQIPINSFTEAEELRKRLNQMEMANELQEWIPGQMSPQKALELTAPVINALGKFGNFVNPFTPLGTDYDLIDLDKLAANESPLHSLTSEIKNYIKSSEANSNAITTWEIERLIGQIDPTIAGGIKRNRTELEADITNHLFSKEEGWKPSSDNLRDKKKIQSLENITIQGIGYDDFNKNLYINISGKTKDNKDVENKQILITDEKYKEKLVAFYAHLEMKAYPGGDTYYNDPYYWTWRSNLKHLIEE